MIVFDVVFYKYFNECKGVENFEIIFVCFFETKNKLEKNKNYEQLIVQSNMKCPIYMFLYQ